MMTSSKATGLNFGLSLLLHPYFVDASSEASGESVHRADSSGPWLLDIVPKSRVLTDILWVLNMKHLKISNYQSTIQENLH